MTDEFPPTEFYLIQRLSCDIDAVHFQNLVVDGQQTRALGQSSPNQTRYEHPGNLHQQVAATGVRNRGFWTKNVTASHDEKCFVKSLSHLLHSLWRHPHTHPVTYVEAQGFVGTVLVKPHAAVRLWQNVHIYDGGDLPEVLGHPNHQAWFVLGVGGA